MRALITFLCAAVALFAQLPTRNGRGGGAGGSGAPLYESTFSAVTTVTVTAATHGLGTKPVSLGCFDAGTPKLAITLTANYPQVAANGDITWAWTGSKTGACYATSSGASGAAGGVLSGTYPNPAFGSPLNLAALAMILPERAFGSLPAAGSSNGHVYVVTDAASAGSCSAGGGSSRALCRSNGSAWEAIGGGAGGGEPVITPGLNTQYWRGDKTWQDLNKAAVGLSNVANVDTTNAGNIASGTLAGARLPNPAVGTKGGVEALTCPGTDKVSAIGTNGIPVCSADSGAGGGAPTDAQYLTLATNAGLSAERALEPGFGITFGDGGPNGALTVAAETAVMESRATAQAGTTTYCRSTTGNDTYTCTLNPALTGYTRGMVVQLDVDTANTGAATVNINGLGNVGIFKRDGTALSDVDIAANRPLLISHNGTNFNIIGDGGGAAGNQIHDPLTAFDDSAWSNGGASLTRNTSVAGRVRYTVTTANGILASRQKSVAAGDFTFRVGIIPYFSKGYQGAPQIGVVLGNSGGTQKLRFCGVTINGSNAHSFFSQTWDSYFNTPSNETLDAPFNLAFSAENFGRGLIWIGWSRSGSTLTCEVSQDGKIWETVRTTDQTYLTATFVGVGGSAAADGSGIRFTVFGGTIP